jgi:hypothetical protein
MNSLTPSCPTSQFLPAAAELLVSDEGRLPGVAVGEYAGNQLSQWTGDILFGDHDLLVIDLDRIDRAPWSWLVHRRLPGSARGELFPAAGVVAAGGVDRTASYLPVWGHLGDGDFHPASLSPFPRISQGTL